MFSITQIKNETADSKINIIQFFSSAPDPASVFDLHEEDDNDFYEITRINGMRSCFVISLTLAEIAPHFPFIGTNVHGLVTSITSDIGPDFSDNSMESAIIRLFYKLLGTGGRLGIMVKNSDITVNLTEFITGRSIPVYIDFYGR
jgi:hypothetical protein